MSRRVFLLLLLATACRQDMHDQPKLRGLRGSEFFFDGRSARPPIPDTVARDGLREDELLHTGKIEGRLAETFPAPVTRDVLLRGQERYDIFCSPCHGPLGDGLGMIVRRGLAAPGSFHVERLRSAPPGYLFDVITRGYRTMQDQADQIRAEDRWAIVAYVRALQLSQNASLKDVPPEERTRLQGQAP